jgi:DNA-binding beta-propeller fold protein YncE
MTPLGLQDVGQVPDVLAIDATAGLLYVAAESGPLTVFQETDSTTSGVQPLVQQSVGPNAHSVAVDPQTHHVYLPLANLDGKPILRELALSIPNQGT